MKDAAEDASKPLPVGYQPVVPHLCIFVSGTSLSKSGPAYHGIPREACVVEEKEAAAIVARWKGSYKLVPVAPGPEQVDNSAFGAVFAKYENVYISAADGMVFSGGIFNTRKGRVSMNPLYTHKLVLRRGADGELYLDNFGSRVLEDSPPS